MEKLCKIFNERKYVLVLVVCLSIYLLLSLIRVNYLGIQYDEILFGNAALGNIDSSFITYSFHGFPVLLMPYIGALKAYTFYPIFKIFGVSVFSVRLPMIILTAFALYVLSKTLKDILNKKIALAVVLLLFVDASFISQMSHDVGPTAIEFFLKTGVLYFFCRYLKNKKNTNVIWIGALLFLGVFNKLNFIWFVNSFIFSATIIYWKDFKKIYLGNSNKWKLILISEIAGICCICLGYFFTLNSAFKLFHPLEFSDLSSRWINVSGNFQLLVDGTSFFNYALGDMNLPASRIYFIIILSIIVAGLLTYLITYKSKKFIYRKEYMFFLLMFVTIFAQIIFTKNATAPWHMFAIYPFITVIIALSIIILMSQISSKRLKYLFLATILMYVVFYQVFVIGKYINAYSQPTKDINWSSKIYELMDYTAKSNYRFISIDWGTHNQLLTFGNKKDKYKEMVWWLNEKQTQKGRAWFIESFILPQKKYAFVMHNEENSNFLNARVNFFSIVDESGFKAKLIKEFSENRKVIYQIYIIE